MPDIETLHVPTINHDIPSRQLASEESTDKRKTTGQSKRAVQTEGMEPESFTNRMQDASVLELYKANIIA